MEKPELWVTFFSIGITCNHIIVWDFPSGCSTSQPFEARLYGGHGWPQYVSDLVFGFWVSDLNLTVTSPGLSLESEMSIDANDILKVTCGGRAEIENLKVWYLFTFSISALSPDITFEMSLHFLHLWTIGQKTVCQILKGSAMNSINTDQKCQEVAHFCLIHSYSAHKK